jgi:hypothetical protein
MPFPQVRDEMVERGYKFSNTGRCRSCAQEIEWWITPREKKQPFNLMPEGGSLAVSHFATCADADLFRKPRA